MSDMTPSDIAEQVLSTLPKATKDEWGREFLRLAKVHGQEQIDEFVTGKTITALGTYIKGADAHRQAVARNDRLMARGVATATGRPITPTLSVRAKDGSRQQCLWVEATPMQFMEAVLLEQRIVDGRRDSNKVRLIVVEAMQADEHLMELSTLGDVCRSLGIDPDALGLEELA